MPDENGKEERGEALDALRKALEKLDHQEEHLAGIFVAQAIAVLEQRRIEE